LNDEKDSFNSHALSLSVARYSSQLHGRAERLVQRSRSIRAAAAMAWICKAEPEMDWVQPGCALIPSKK